MHVFQPPLVKLFTGSPMCPIRGPTGEKPVVHRIERWVLATSIRPIESRAVFRVIAAVDTARYAVDTGACAHPDGCSLANGRNGIPGPSACNGNEAPRARRSGLSARIGARSPLSNFSFADDVIFPNGDENVENPATGSDDSGAPTL